MEEKSARYIELVTNARLSLSIGDNSAAREFAKLLLKEFPKSEEGWLVLASISETGDAISNLENALRINPDSQAARQAIRLITRQVLNEKQVDADIPEMILLEDTQPIKTEDINAENLISDAVHEYVGNSEIETEFQDIQEINEDQVALDDIVIEIEPAPEFPDETSLVEEFPEFQPDMPEKTIENEGTELEKKDELINSVAPFVKKKVYIRKKKAKPNGEPQVVPNVISSNIIKTDQKFRQKRFNVEIVELFLIAGTAVLLPVLVFLFFYFTK